MNREQIEFAISRLLDGDLSAGEIARLEAVLASDPSARKLCDELQAINQNLKSASPLPAVNWDRLADTISASAAQQHLARGGQRPAIRLPANDAIEDAVVRAVTGDITKAEQAGLDRLTETDSAARELLAQHRALDVALQHGLPRPDVDGPQLARQLGNTVAQHHAVVADSAAGDTAIDEPTEQSIVQLVDGELTVTQESELSRKLAASPAVRQALKEHRSLDVLLKHGQPLPHVDFAVLGQRISQAVAEADAAAERTISLSQWMHRTSRIAIAACVLLGVTLLARTFMHPADPTAVIAHPVHEIIAMDVHPADPVAPRVIEVSVGPSKQLAGQGFDYYAAGAVVAVPSRIQIAERITPASTEDFGALPY
ncbi:MAG: hypothetical protein ABSH20_16450 [Tepidisphaeraceae bacterium]|jgi:anti-sigma factor RsiW